MCPVGFVGGDVFALSNDPMENARLCREAADATGDKGLAHFLRELADDYEEMARATPEKDDRP